MPMIRLIYFSENLIEPNGRSVLSQLNDVLAASQRNNERDGITGALVFDDRWFLQILEGERAAVWRTLHRISDDERHANVVIAEAAEVEERLFGNWWMGLATRNAETAPLFAPYLRNGLLRPQDMSARAILDLVVRLANVGLSRKMAAAA